MDWFRNTKFSLILKNLFKIPCNTLFFYKNFFYKNVEAEINPDFKNVLRTYPSWD